MKEPPHDQRSARRALIGSYVGTSLEWYDFFLFGTTASIVFAPLFFGGDDPALQTIQSFLAFGVGFIGRPLGAVFFGHFGDRLGRKGILVATIVLMGVASALIGLLPTYATAGLVAPILLAILRFAQGVAAGGEWGGAMLMAVESAPKNRRALYGAVVQLGSPTGTLLSSMAVAGAIALSGTGFLEWGWRLPYLFSIVLVAVGVWLRLRVVETNEFKAVEANEEQSKVPLLTLLAESPLRLVVGVGAYLMNSAGFFMLTTFMISYVTGTLELEASVILTAISVGAVLQIVVTTVVGLFSDRLSASRMLIVGYAISVVTAFPIFWLVDTKQTVAITFAMILALGIGSISYAVLGTTLTQVFPVRVRYSGIALSANIAGVVAGFTPALAAWVLSTTGGSSTGPAVLLLGLALISLVGSIAARRIIVGDARRASTPVGQ